MDILLSMAIFALVTSISPGPVNIIAAISAANFGFYRSTPHILGATAGFSLLLLIIGFGMGGILKQYPVIHDYLAWVGSLFILYLSYKIATMQPYAKDTSKLNTPPTIIEGLLCQWLNPKAWIVATSGIAVYAGHVDAYNEQIILLSITFFLICFPSISTWSLFGVVIGRLLNNATYFRFFNVSMGLILAISVLVLLL